MLFKRFADIDVFDLEIGPKTRSVSSDCVGCLEPTFGGINLEDIRAPDCFVIERELRARMDIPVFHDDQHGTAIISGAALRNAAEFQHKELGDPHRLAAYGAGAAAIELASSSPGAHGREAGEHHVHGATSGGVLREGRGDLDEFRARCRPAAERSRGTPHAGRGHRRRPT